MELTSVGKKLIAGLDAMILEQQALAASAAQLGDNILMALVRQKERALRAERERVLKDLLDDLEMARLMGSPIKGDHSTFDPVEPAPAPPASVEPAPAPAPRFQITPWRERQAQQRARRARREPRQHDRLPGERDVG